ncbi:unnamed protein product [Chrysoparadoxa australica]
MEGPKWMVISWDPQASRVHIGPAPPRGKEGEMYSFSQQLRTFLKGLTLTQVSLPCPFDRVICLDFSNRIEELPAFQLMVEIMGSRSNVVLVAADSKEVACCAYQVSPKKSVRPIGVGQPYSLPPMQRGLVPAPDSTRESFEQIMSEMPAQQQVKKVLVSCYQGVSPVLSSLLLAAVPGLSPSTPVSKITAEQWQQLHDGPWKQWLKLVYDEEAQEPYSPWYSVNEDSYYPILFGACPDGTAVSDTVSSILASYYSERVADDGFQSLMVRCQRRCSATADKLRQRVEEFRAQLVAAGEGEETAGEQEGGGERASCAELIRTGDLLSTYGLSWKPGDPDVVAYDFETNEEVRVPITPGRSPIEEAQRSYQKAKKLKRSIVIVKELLETALEQTAYLESIELALDELNQASDLAVLKEIALELGVEGGKEGKDRFLALFGAKQVQQGGGGTNGGRRGKGGRDKGGKKGKATANGTLNIVGKKQAMKQLDGILQLQREESAPRVLVGRNNLQNERITFSIGKATDLWYHARGCAGAHVLLRCEAGRDPDEADEQFAADLAAYYSKGRGDTEVPVDMLSPKQVRKIPGSGPGMVRFDGGAVVWGRPERVAEVAKLQQGKVGAGAPAAAG